MSVQPARWGQNKVIKIAHTVSASDRLALGIEKTTTKQQQQTTTKQQGDQDHEVVAHERQTRRWRQNKVIKSTKLKLINIQRKVENKRGDQDRSVVANVYPAYKEETKQGDKDRKVLVKIRQSRQY